MAITPIVVVDDDGTLTTGTVWNAAHQTLLEANINAADCLDRSTTEQAVANTTTPTAVYSYSVPGGTLGTNRILRLSLTGLHVNTSGGSVTLAIKITYGATDLVTGTVFNFATATQGAIRLVLELSANGATNSQRAVVQMVTPGNGVTQAAAAWASAASFSAFLNTVAEDSTAAKTLAVTITHGSAAATISFKRFAAFLQVRGS